jgi:hypothetical protein
MRRSLAHYCAAAYTFSQGIRSVVECQNLSYLRYGLCTQTYCVGALKRLEGKMSTKKITLIVSDEKEPTISISLKPNTRIELVQVATKHDGKTAAPEPVLATLCGYESTYCIALVEEQASK